MSELTWIKDTKCPACKRSDLYIGSGGYITCSHLGCPEPDYEKALEAQLQAAKAEAEAEQQRALMRQELEDFREQLEDDDDPTPSWIITTINEMIGHNLPKSHPDYWKYHCVTCGLWLRGQPEQEGYCQCE